jgi:TPR repeat protein
MAWNNLKFIIFFFLDCWSNEPDNRPTINQIVMKLNAIITDFQKNNFNADIQLSSKQMLKSNIEIHEKMSQIIQNFNKMNIKEVKPSMTSVDIFAVMVNEIILLLEDTEAVKKKNEIVNYCDKHNTTSQEIYNWLISNQDNSYSVFLLGIFYHYGIEVNAERQRAFELFQNAANSGNVHGICSLGYFYQKGIGTIIDKQKAFELYQMAANLGNSRGMINLGHCYCNGIGTSIDRRKGFELYEKAANLGSVLGIISLGYCYLNGFGTNVDNQKAFEIFQKAANLGDNVAQYNLAYMHENGEGIKEDINQAIYWYKKSAEQGDQDAKNKLNKLIDQNNM